MSGPRKGNSPQQAAYSKVSTEEIAAYYKENSTRYEQAELDRIFIPRVNGKQPKAGADFEKKALAIATAIRERAAKGEDMAKLQVEAYQSLGMTPPLTTDMGMVRRTALPRAAESDVFSLRAGEVTPVETDAAGFTIYRLRARTSLPLESAKEEIRQVLAKKKMDVAAESAANRVHYTYNEEFFHGAKSSPR